LEGDRVLRGREEVDEGLGGGGSAEGLGVFGCYIRRGGRAKKGERGRVGVVWVLVRQDVGNAEEVRAVSS